MKKAIEISQQIDLMNESIKTAESTEIPVIQSGIDWLKWALTPTLNEAANTTENEDASAETTEKPDSEADTSTESEEPKFYQMP